MLPRGPTPDGGENPYGTANLMKSNERIVAQAGDTDLYHQQRGFFRLIEIRDKIQFGHRQVSPKQIERLKKLRGIK